ncbi:MAG: hypothetical protein QXP04_05125, partial [Candidatus Nanoarchaeia archaeon]|nr:hypothetical protein [Candidatus Jingweiarchaeum tengchongense]
LTYPTTPQNWINGSTYNITCSMICDGGSCIFVYPYAVYAPNITNWYIIGSESDPYKNILLGPGEKNPKELITIVPPNIIKSINLTLLANKPSTNLIACNGTSIYSDSPTSASSKVQITILPLDTEAPIIYPDANATPTISNSAIKLNQTVKDNVNVSLVYFTINSVNYSTNRNGDEFYRIGICAESKEYNWTDTWANDTSGNMNHSIIGLKFICDVNAPLINLISPENSTITTSQNLNFTFIATDDMFTKFTCNIFLDLGLNQTNVSVVNNTLTTFTINGISIGNHTWYIKCRDTAGNLRESEKRTFSIIIPPATCGDGICDNGETSLNCPKDCCNESVIESDANCCSFYNYTWISGYGCCGNSIEEGVCGSYCYNKNTKKCCLDGYYLCFLSECCSNYTCYSQGTCKDQMVCKSGSWEFNCTICPCPTNRICVNNVCVEKKCSELYCCSDADCPEVCNAGYLVKRYCPTIGGVCAERSRTNCPYGCIITSCYTTKQNLNIFVQMDKDVYEKNELMRIAGNVFYSDNKTNNFSVIITFKNGNWSISKKLNTTQDGRFDYQYWISFSDPEGMWEIKVDATDNFGNAGSWSSMKEVVLSSTSIYNVTFLVPEIEQNFKRGEMINITVNVTTNYLPVSGANATATLFIYGQEKIGVPLLEIENGIYNGNYTINYNDALGFWMISVQVIKNEGGKTFGGGNFTRIVVLPANIILQLLSP